MSADASLEAPAPRRLFGFALQRHHYNTAIYLGISLLSKGASVLLLPIYSSRLSRGEYAIYGLCQTLFWIGPALFTMSLSAAFGRFYFDHREAARRDQVLGAIAVAIVGMSLAGALVCEALFAAVPTLHAWGLDTHLLRLVVWTCVAVAMTDIPSLYFRASESAARFGAYNLSIFGVTIAATLYLLLVRHAGLYALLWGSLVGQGAGALFALAFTCWGLRPGWSKTVLGEALRYSIPFIPHMIGNSLMVGVDRWALEANGLRDDLGLYTVATQLTSPIQLATNAWNEASSPRFLAAWRDGGDAAARRSLPRIVAGFLASGGGALAAILLALPLFRLIVHPRFHAAFRMVPWLGLSLCVGVLFSAFINVLFLRKTTRIIPVLTMSSVVANVVFNWFLVPRWGVWGAILATGAAFALRSGIMCAFALRALKPSAHPAAG
jgi:O-antigen/teichoic acid export membrane protein